LLRLAHIQHSRDAPLLRLTLRHEDLACPLFVAGHVLVFVLAVLITPTPDVLTMMAMGLPMYLLYESCIWIAWFIQRKQRKKLA
jgi:hypothetical protein